MNEHSDYLKYTEDAEYHWKCDYCGRTAFLKDTTSDKTYYCSKCYKEHHPDGIRNSPDTNAGSLS